MIIDVHCHVGRGDGLTGPWDTRASLRRYIGWAHSAGIAATVVFAPFSSDYRAANRRTVEISRRSRSHQLVPFACVHPQRDRGRIGAMVAEAARLGARGLKVHHADATVTREVADAAARHRLVVLYDPMGNVAPIEMLATEYRGVDWIVPHLGSFADDWAAQRVVIDLLTRHPNVYADTSGVRRFDLLEEAVSRAGAEKILFGSDGPWLHPGVELSKVHLLEIPADRRALILGGNAARLLRLDQPRHRATQWDRKCRVNLCGLEEAQRSRTTAAASRERPS